MLTLQIRTLSHNANKIALVELQGSIDSLDSLKLERSLLSILQEPVHDIILDLGQIGFISSAGWGVFISKISLLRDQGGSMRFASMGDEVERSFNLIGLGAIQNVGVHLSVHDAVVACETQSLS